MFRRSLPTLALVGLVFSTSPVQADDALRVVRAKPGDVRVDGSLSEWADGAPQRLQVPDGATAAYWLAYDGEAIYLGARIADATPVPGARAGRKGDALLLRVSTPTAQGRYRDTDVWLYPGVAGEVASRAELSPRTAAKVLVVEGPVQDGRFALEARIPRAAITGGDNIHLARASLSLQDVSRSGAKPRTARSAAGRGRTLPAWRLQGGAGDALAELRTQRDLPPGAPAHDFVADFTGDAQLERIAVFGRMLVVLGADDRLTYRELPVMGAADVLDASLRDLTGDRRPELMLTLRQRNGQGERQLVQVFDLQSGTPAPLWGVETLKRTADGEVRARLAVREGRRGQPPRLVLTADQSEGLGPHNYQERAAADVAGILLPWGKVRQRSYAFVDGRFTVVDEEDNPDYEPPQPASVATRARSGQPPREVRDAREATPPPPGNAALVDAFRQAQGIDAGLKARFVRTVNLAGDARRETLLVLGKHLLVVGEGYREGRGYFYFELPVASPQDLLWVFTGDVTGDGRRELFVRVRRPSDDVQREVLLGYTFEGEAMRPIFQGEVRRARGGDSVGNVVALVRAGKHWALRIAPGRAVGWSDGNYPFAPDPPGVHARLLLPWADAAVDYRYDGQALVPR